MTNYLDFSTAPTLAFNTGRRYSPNGQRIAVVQLDGGHIAFLDLDRGIEGVLRYTGVISAAIFMNEYNFCDYVGGFYHIGLDYSDAMRLRKHLETLAATIRIL